MIFSPVVINDKYFLQTSNQDFSKPIDLQIISEIDNSKVRNRRKRQSGGRFCKTCAVIDPNSLATVTARVPYSTGCKKDDVCETDLSIKAKISEKYENFLILEMKS